MTNNRYQSKSFQLKTNINISAAKPPVLVKKNEHTEILQSDSEDGVCNFDDHEKWLVETAHFFPPQATGEKSQFEAGDALRLTFMNASQ